MNLFINAVTQNWTLILFNTNKKILFQKNIEILGNESSKLIETIDVFLWENNIKYSDLDNLVVVNWPWSFTGVRTIVLAINTINFIIKKNITAINFFDLFENYPIIKSSSRRDLFVKYKKSDKIEIVKNDDFIKTIIHHPSEALPLKGVPRPLNTKGSKVYWDLSNNILSERIEVISKIDYNKIIKNIIFQKNKLIEPLYIKKPNIS